MSIGNKYSWDPGFDYDNDLQKVGMFYWDTQTLAYAKWQGNSTTPDVAIANFPAVSTITGTVTATAPSITTVTGAVYVASVTSHQGPGGTSAWPVALATTSISGNVGVSGAVAATQSGNWAVGVTGGNVAATQSGNWNVGVLSGNITATLSGTNFIVATLSTGTAITGGVYPVSGLIQNERANIVPGSISFGNATTTGYITLVAAQGSGIITRVLSIHCMSAGYNGVALFSGINGTGSTITSTKPVPAYGGWVSNFNPQGWCETGANQALSFYQSVATDTGIDVVWATTS